MLYAPNICSMTGCGVNEGRYLATTKSHVLNDETASEAADYKLAATGLLVNDLFHL